jgi:hypothetical protein
LPSKLRNLLGVSDLLLEEFDLAQLGRWGRRRRKRRSRRRSRRRSQRRRRKRDHSSVDTLKFLVRQKHTNAHQQEARSKKQEARSKKQEARMCIISWLQEAIKQESDQVSHRRRTELLPQVLEVLAFTREN